MMQLLVWMIIISIDMRKCFIRRYNYLLLKLSSYNVIKNNCKYNYNGDQNIFYQSLLLNSLGSNNDIEINSKLYRDHSIHHHQQPHLKIDNDKNDINVIRTIITRQIDDCWYEIRRLVPKESLILFENELIDSISLVVLATLRRSAEEYSTSRYLIREMLREADVNSDGKLSYSEWYRWLRNTSIDVNDVNDIHDAQDNDDSSGDDNDGNDKARPNHSGDRHGSSSRRRRFDSPYSRSSNNDNVLSSSDDPMITSLRSVFDHALSTLTIITRITNDPHILSTSFIAGSIAAGVLDDSICKRIMSKMSPSSCELLIHALSLESASLSRSATQAYLLLQPRSPSNSISRIAGNNKDDDIGSSSSSKSNDRNGSNNFGRDGGRVRMNIHGDKIIPCEINDHESKVNGSNYSSSSTSTTTSSSSSSSSNSRSGSSKDDSITISAANFDLDSSDVEDSSNDNSIVLSLDIITPPSLSSSSSIPPSSNKGSYFDPIINENQSVHDYIANNSDDLITTKGTIIHTIGFVSYNSNRTGADDHHESDFNVGIDDSDFDSVVYHSGYEEDAGIKINNDDAISKFDANDNDNDVWNTNNDSSSSSSSRGSQVDEMIVVSSPSPSKQTTRDETDVSNELTTISSNTQQHNTVNNIIDRITTLMLDASELRNSIIDLDDKQASTLRSLLFSKSMQRQDIMGLSLAIRTVRLKYLYKKPMHIRHQIALETLQLWGPLSFQIGYANSIPELEIYSYIQLFTKSFSSFINWYTIFQPIGKKLINNFCLKLENKLSKQKKLSFIFSKILIQSRIKTPSSAFKKMLNNAKMKDELYDILGIRIIATNRNNHHHDHYHNDDNNQQLSFDSQDYDDSSFDNYSDDDIDRRMNSDRIRRRWNGNYNNTSSINTTDTHDRGYNENVEYLGLLNIRSIIHSITEWGENIDRFKDYIKYPKRSGYQSLHMNIHHEYSNANMEIQIRSDRMHEMAEYGPASHRYYKALILPKEVEV